MDKVLQWALIVSLAGLLFGFDMVVISGAEQQLQAEWEVSDAFHGFFIMAAALWGTVIGAMFSSPPIKKLGRKKSLKIIGGLFLLSALGSSLAIEPYSFGFFRFLGGLGVGASTIAAPAYIAEISPSNKRGKLVAMYQLSIVLGVLLAMFSNYLLQDVGEDAWRWMLGAEILPAILFLAFLSKIPMSPRWLFANNRKEEAIELIKKFQLAIHLEEQTKAIIKTDSIYSSKYRRILYLVFFIAFFNQFSGINAILYYAPRIFEEAGLARSEAFLGGIWIGVVNLIFTLVGISIIDRFGRKKLMYLGSLGYILSLSGAAIAFHYNWQGFVVLIFILTFIASHAIGQGTVIWVFISELFPTQLRSAGQSFGSTVHWVLAAILPAMIPIFISKFGASMVFLLFATMMILQLLWVFLYMPETKGRELDTLSESLST